MVGAVLSTGTAFFYFTKGTPSKRKILNTIKRRKANWIGHILHRNCLLKHVIEGKLEGRIEMTGRRGRRCKQLLDDLMENRRHWKLKKKHWIAPCGELTLEEATNLL
jgi:hypothetical protein